MPSGLPCPTTASFHYGPVDVREFVSSIAKGRVVSSYRFRYGSGETQDRKKERELQYYEGITVITTRILFSFPIRSTM